MLQKNLIRTSCVQTRTKGMLVEEENQLLTMPIGGNASLREGRSSTLLHRRRLATLGQHSLLRSFADALQRQQHLHHGWQRYHRNLAVWPNSNCCLLVRLHLPRRRCSTTPLSEARHLFLPSRQKPETTRSNQRLLRQLYTIAVLAAPIRALIQQLLHADICFVTSS